MTGNEAEKGNPSGLGGAGAAGNGGDARNCNGIRNDTVAKAAAPQDAASCNDGGNDVAAKVAGPQDARSANDAASSIAAKAAPQDAELGFSLDDLHMSILRAFHAQRAQLRPFGASLGLGPGQPKLLSYLAVRGSATQRDIADFFGIDPAAVCRMLDVLDRKGFVRTSANPDDRRTKVLALTSAGRAAVRAWDGRCREVEAQMLRGLTADEASQLHELLARVTHNLRDESLEPAPVPKPKEPSHE